MEQTQQMPAEVFERDATELLIELLAGL